VSSKPTAASNLNHTTPVGYVKVALLTILWQVRMCQWRVVTAEIGCRGCREYLDLRGNKWQEAGEDCIMRIFITCKLHQILLG
jgi:hypothetical protein